MGFFDDVGNWLGDLTGINQSKSANQLKGQGAGNMQAGATVAGGIANKGAGQFAQEAGQAGQALGEQMGRQAATSGSQAATQAARTAGVNKGQAALLGGQEAGRAFTQGQQAGQGLGMGAYGQGAGIQLGGAGTQGQIGYNQTGGGQASQDSGTKAGGGLLGAIGGLFSDEKVKEDIKEAPKLEEITQKIEPVGFKYKDEMGQGDGEHVGITAQDMEKTPLKENVIDTPEGKMIHPGKQENSNLSMIVQLSRKVDELLKQRSA
jgi:hypothetical protein